ncbi:MAG: (4Fe-4S)-binding protein [Bacteroidia bacterium]|nr:(4Fe-4S)-binding protein [Bacteroidia bacterium]
MSEEKKITKEYSNGEVTVVWKPDVCIHSGICFGGLPRVFNPRKRPWVTIDGAETEAIVAQVKKCPSGALSFYMNEDARKGNVEVETERIIEVVPNGPLLVYGNITIKKPDGSETRDAKVTAFCRCGGSSNKPFCDGTHRKNGFEG